MIRLDDVAALPQGLFNSPGNDEQEGTPEIPSPTQDMEGEPHGLNLQHSKRDRNNGTGLRL